MPGLPNPVRSAAPARLVASALAAFAAACGRPAPAPGPQPAPEAAAPAHPAAPVYVARGALPPIPRVDAPLAIRVRHPTGDDPLPSVDSTFVFGSVGSGDAALVINDVPVPVAPNGAFLAFLPVPADGAYHLVARRGADSASAVAAFHPRPVAAPAAPPVRPDSATEFGPPAPRPAPATNGALATPVAVLTTTSDTLQTGSDVAVGRPTPTGTYRWFLPRGARLTVIARRAGMVQARLDSATTAWFPDTAVVLAGPASAPMPPVRLGRITTRRDTGWVDVRIPARGAPFLVIDSAAAWTVRVYGATSADSSAASVGDAMLAGIRRVAAEPGAVDVALSFNRRPWGYKAFYEADGTLVVRLRRAPRIDPAHPLAGIRVAVDPGHPPAGAIGPTGMTEAEANLAIALPLAEQLRAAGAEVMLTRTTNVSVALAARPAMAVAWNADLLVSVHNNAFAEGQNPFAGAGTSAYWFHPQSAALAEALDREIVGVTGIRDLGAHADNLALVRATWMPSVLTESLFMMVPEQEAAVRDPGFLAKLAAAHVRGLEAYLRSRAADSR